MFHPKLLRASVDHMTPLLASFHWLPFKSGIVLKILLLTNEVIRGRAPSWLEEQTEPSSLKRALRILTDL